MRGVSSTRGGGRGRPAVATTAASRVDPSRRPAITAATMVYESDFYTTRRTYGRPSYSTYSVTRRRVDWSRHPTVPRPSLIPEPVTAFAARRPPPYTPSVSSAAPAVRVPLPVPVHRRVLFQGLPGTSVIRRY